MFKANDKFNGKWATCSKPTIKLVEQGVLCSKSTILFVKLCVYVQKQQSNKASGAMCCLLKFDIKARLTMCFVFNFKNKYC